MSFLNFLFSLVICHHMDFWSLKDMPILLNLMYMCCDTYRLLFLVTGACAFI